MIFIQSTNESIIQAGDKTRIDVSNTFLSPDEAAITLVEIRPTTLGDYVDVTSDLRLDWVYSTAQDETISVRVTTDGAPETSEYSITVISQADDRLFSSDQDILFHEIDLYKYLRAGRNTFLDIHRAAQENILDELDQNGYTNNAGDRLTKDDIYDIQEVKEWSKYEALSIIFRSVQSEVGDIFEQKASLYEAKAKKAQSRAQIRLDLNQDGTADHKIRIMSGRLVRR